MPSRRAASGSIALDAKASSRKRSALALQVQIACQFPLALGVVSTYTDAPADPQRRVLCHLPTCTLGRQCVQVRAHCQANRVAVGPAMPEESVLRSV